MSEAADSLARALISVHGAGALIVAERAAQNVRSLGLKAKVAEWEQVIAAIKAMQKAAD